MPVTPNLRTLTTAELVELQAARPVGLIRGSHRADYATRLLAAVGLPMADVFGRYVRPFLRTRYVTPVRGYQVTFGLCQLFNGKVYAVAELHYRFGGRAYPLRYHVTLRARTHEARVRVAVAPLNGYANFQSDFNRMHHRLRVGFPLDRMPIDYATPDQWRQYVLKLVGVPWT